MARFAHLEHLEAHHLQHYASRARDAPLPSMRTAVSGTLLKVLGEVLVAIRVYEALVLFPFTPGSASASSRVINLTPSGGVNSSGE